MAAIDDQKTQEPPTPCTPQLIEIENVIPAQCGQSYVFQQPLLLQTWEQSSITTSVTNITTSCSGGVTTNPQPNGSVNMTLNGTASGCSNTWLFDVNYSSRCVDSNGVGVIGTVTYSVTGGKPVDVNFTASFPPSPPCGTGALQVVVEGGGTLPATGSICPPSPCLNFVEYPPVATFAGNVRITGGTPCETKVTIKWEGCSKKPAGTYAPDETPPPGGTSSLGGAAPSGNPPSTSPPPPSDAPSSYGGDGGTPPPLGGGGASPPSGGGASNPPTPYVGSNQPSSGFMVQYPDGTVLTPQPQPEFPPIIVTLPGGDVVPMPWNGYAVYPGIAVGQVAVLGNAYPAIYVSPMIHQRTFYNWKVLKHAFVQLENETTDIHTALTTADAALRGKAIHRFNANVGIIYNDENAAQVIEDLYRYDNTLWSADLYSKHYSPKQLDRIVVFKEPLQGVSYAYQLVLFSQDEAVWKLVGWQIEGKLKGNRVGHSRN